MPRFYSSASKAERLKPDELPGSIGVLSDPGKPGSTIGIAFGVAHLGGWRTDFRPGGFSTEYLGPTEAVWRLKIGKDEVEGRFALKAGEFIELAEDAS